MTAEEVRIVEKLRKKWGIVLAVVALVLVGGIVVAAWASVPQNDGKYHAVEVHRMQAVWVVTDSDGFTAGVFPLFEVRRVMKLVRQGLFEDLDGEMPCVDGDKDSILISKFPDGRIWITTDWNEKSLELGEWGDMSKVLKWLEQYLRAWRFEFTAKGEKEQ